MRSIILIGSFIFLLIGASIVPSVAEAQEIPIVLNGIAFSPQRIHAHVGDRISWVNNDAVRHEILFARNPTDSENPHLRYQLKPGQSVSIIVTKPGDYNYKCRWHGMTGSIHVD
jgi:plastocyanin